MTQDEANRTVTPRENLEVFLSYSRKDIHACERLAKDLTFQGVKVHVDTASLQPADILKSKLGDLIDRSQATVCLLSAHSLKSPWVMWEVSRNQAQWESGRNKLIPVFLDKSFLDDAFIDEVSGYIQSEIVRLGKATLDCCTRKEPTAHLDQERDRYQGMRDGFSGIIRKFRGMDALSLVGTDYDRSLSRLYMMLSDGKAPPRRFGSQDLKTTDFATREREIGELIMEGRNREAIQLCLGYLRDFRPHEPGRLRSAIAIGSKLSHIEKISDPVQQNDLTGKIAMEILDVIGYGMQVAA